MTTSHKRAFGIDTFAVAIQQARTGEALRWRPFSRRRKGAVAAARPGGAALHG